MIVSLQLVRSAQLQILFSGLCKEEYVKLDKQDKGAQETLQEHRSDVRICLTW